MTSKLDPGKIEIGNDNAETPSFAKSFLEDINCARYLDAFNKYGLVDEADLKYIDKDILGAIGVTKIGDRIRILRKVRGLGKKAKAERTEANIAQLKELIEKIGALSVSLSSTVPTEEVINERNHTIFILNDGSAKRVNVSGCFNADSIKKRLLKKLPPELLATNHTGDVSREVEDYDVFVVDYVKNVLHLLFDVELVTICHSVDRTERNRLILVSKLQTPSESAIATSKKLHFRSASASEFTGLVTDDSMLRSTSTNGALRSQLRIDNSQESMRKVFNQRPPSELISTNLSGYFPSTDVKKLQKTLRDSYRQSMRINSQGRIPINPESNKIGDILLKHSSAVDTALLQSLPQNQNTVTSSTHISRNGTGTANITMRSGNSDFLSLYGDGSDDEYDDVEGTSDMVSLPTKIETPKAWLKGARIGAGSFGSVYLGMNATTGELMAVKQVRIQPLASATKDEDKPHNGGKKPAKNLSEIHKKMVDALQHEMVLLKDLHHENIVTYYGSSEEGGNINIFLEYVPGGSVSSMLNNYGPFEESLIINFTRQILIGVAYLHRKNIIHRDIKGANILIDIKGCVKITDFGISKKLSPFNNKQKQDKRASLQGSVFWMAPEVVKQTATTSKVDIWSTGCVVIEMFTGKHPFPDFSQMQAIFKIGTNTSPDVPTWASEVSCDFLKKSFELDYKQRPSAVDLLQHPWLDTKII